MNATDLHLLVRKNLKGQYETAQKNCTIPSDSDIWFYVNAKLEDAYVPGNILSGGHYELKATRDPETGTFNASFRVRTSRGWDLSFDVSYPPPGHDRAALHVADLAAQLNSYVEEGNGDHYVVMPGVAGDIFLERDQVYVDDSDAPERPVCVVGQAQRDAPERRVRQSSPISCDELDRILDEREELTAANKALTAKLSELQRKVADLKADVKRMEEVADSTFPLQPGNVLDFSAQVDSVTNGAVIVEGMKVFMSREEVQELTAKVADARVAMHGEMANTKGCDELLQDLSAKGHIINLNPRDVRKWESFQAAGSKNVTVKMVVSERAFKFGMMPGLQENRVEALPAGHARREYTAMEDAVIILRAKLLENTSPALVDEVLMRGLRDVVGDDWYGHLVGDTEEVLARAVKLPPKENIAGDRYVHLRPTNSEFGKTVKTILFCGAAISEHNPPDMVYAPNSATCPHCLVAHERKWRTFMAQQVPE